MENEPIEIPIDRLSESALEGLVEELVTRDGTDYGARECSLDEKKAAVFRQLERGELMLVFFTDSESCQILPRDSPGSRDRRV